MAICPVCEHETRTGWQCEQCGRELRMSPERLQAKKLKVESMNEMVSTHAEKIDVQIVPSVDVLRPNGSASFGETPQKPLPPKQNSMTPPDMPAVALETTGNSEAAPAASLPLGPDARKEGWVEDHVMARDNVKKSVNDDTQTCASCGVANSRDAAFCKSCSYQLPRARTRSRDAEEVIIIRCRSCGQPVVPDTQCRECGTKSAPAASV